MGILETWEVSPKELDEIVTDNPSLRGFMMGYVAEYKARKLFNGDDGVIGLVKHDDHDRTRKADITFQYKGVEIMVEVKSLQTNSIKKLNEGTFIGKFQCDASDRRAIMLPTREVVETTCLATDEFDIIAVNLFSFEKKWRFAFAKNSDLPRTNSNKYTPEQRRYLLATLMTVTWPLQPPFVDNPFPLIDEIASRKR